MNIVNFKNHLLISTQKLSNSFFYRTVIYIYKDNNFKINGVIINKKIKNLTVKSFLKKTNIKIMKKKFLNKINNPIILGGLKEKNKGLVIHCFKKIFLSNIYVSPSVSITKSKDILKYLKKKKHFKKMLIILGHCSWKKKELEKEIYNNNWLLTLSNKNILFNISIKNKWEKSMKKIGIKNFHNLIIKNG
ncbi:MAG: YqgE/AlgH family protein [Buchnera aphidicola (Periphyllus lyropictus)]|uniref:YqgE/AlgH family protein n=1 Tax=Buchnera aphidicola TaxID=9 RepID=UPI001ECEB363|nr:YqgE/AlgH family protein [Buchnera aphidicola]NIH16451.1 YqgE/AlgH family protein [Buchnera aphidicola (Periphyllus lyropictus)]USS94736.1 YqgE/AlgH family protein [Buchnera aphidicola (Periphyllus lyropictus)]